LRGDLNGEIGTFLRADAAEESEICGLLARPRREEVVR